MEISVSYSRKLSHEMYGGNAYESSDFFVALKQEIADDVQPEEAHNELAALAEDMVQDRINKEIEGFQNGVPLDEFKKFVYDYVAGRKIDGERYYAMSPYQKDIVQTIKKGKATNKRDNENQKRGTKGDDHGEAVQTIEA